MSIADNAIKEAVDFALREQGILQKESGQEKPDSVKVLSAQKQIAKGTNYKLRLRITSDGVDKEAEIVIHCNLDNKMTLISSNWKKE